MANAHSSRVGATSGILFVVLLFAGVVLGDTTLIKDLPEPPFDASGSQLATYFAGAQFAQLLKAYLVVASGLVLVGFLGEVTRTVHRAATPPRRVATVAFAFGVLGSGLTVVAGGVTLPVVLNIRHGVDAAEARIVSDISYAFYICSWLALASCLALVAIRAARIRSVSFWLGWPAVVAAICLVLAAVAFASYGWVWFVYDVFLVWVAATSIALLRRRDIAE